MVNGGEALWFFWEPRCFALCNTVPEAAVLQSDGGDLHRKYHSPKLRLLVQVMANRETGRSSYLGRQGRKLFLSCSRKTPNNECLAEHRARRVVGPNKGRRAGLERGEG